MEITASASVDVPSRPVKHGQEPLKFKVYAWSLFAVDLSILAVGLWVNRGVFLVGPEVVLWIALVALVDFPSKPIGRSLYFSLDVPILLAAGFLFGPIVAGVIALIGSVDRREFNGGVSLAHAVGNRAQVSLSVIAAAAAFQIAGGQVGKWPVVAVAGLVSLLVDIATNLSLVGVLSYFYGNQASSILESMTVGPLKPFALTYGGLGLVSLAIAELYSRIGLWSLVLGVIPVFLCREVFAKTVQLESIDQDLQSKKKALAAVSEQMSFERTDERLRIASSLHDDVIQSLHSVTIHAEVIRQVLRSGRLLQLDDDIPALVTATRQAADLTRSVIRDLRASPLARGGLLPTIRAFADDLADERGCEISTSMSDDVIAGPLLELLIYQVARESLINAVLHSGAASVRLTLERIVDQAVLTIVDEGRGFDVRLGSPEGHFGLALMKERVDSVGGSLSVESTPGLGTAVRAQFPLGLNS